MTDFHAFEKGGEHFLFFPRSARLYQLSLQAACSLSEFSGTGCEPAASALRAPGPSLGDTEQPAPVDELRALLQRERELTLPVNGGRRPRSISSLWLRCGENAPGTWKRCPDISGSPTP